MIIPIFPQSAIETLQLFVDWMVWRMLVRISPSGLWSCLFSQVWQQWKDFWQDDGIFFRMTSVEPLHLTAYLYVDATLAPYQNLLAIFKKFPSPLFMAIWAFLQFHNLKRFGSLQPDPPVTVPCRPTDGNDTTLDGPLAPAMQFGFIWSVWFSTDYTPHTEAIQTPNTTNMHKHRKIKHGMKSKVKGWQGF